MEYTSVNSCIKIATGMAITRMAVTCVIQWRFDTGFFFFFFQLMLSIKGKHLLEETSIISMQ